MINHNEVHVIFKNIEHQLRENILHHSLHYNFLESLYLIEKYLSSTQNYLLEVFTTMPNHINYVYPNI